MSTLALNIRMRGKLAVIIGGGAIALRKLRTLLRTGASVRIVAMEVCPEITAMGSSNALEVKVGSYAKSDLNCAFLVIAATDNAQVNERVCADARERGILVAVADKPASGDCIFPAILQRGELEIAVSTGGRCPTFAVDVRDVIGARICPEYGVILDRLGAEREKLLTNGSSSTYNKQVLHSLARGLLDELIECKETPP